VEGEEGDSRYMARELLDTVKCEDLPRCDVFSLGATMYEVCLVDRRLPSNGDEWHSIRDGTLQVMPVLTLLCGPPSPTCSTPSPSAGRMSRPS
jgi:hypothetical protein